MGFFATCVYLRGNLPARLATQRKSLRKFNLWLLATTCEYFWPGLKALCSPCVQVSLSARRGTGWRQKRYYSCVRGGSRGWVQGVCVLFLRWNLSGTLKFFYSECLIELQSLIGSLKFTCKAVISGRTFLQHMIDFIWGVHTTVFPSYQSLQRVFQRPYQRPYRTILQSFWHFSINVTKNFDHYLFTN